MKVPTSKPIQVVVTNRVGTTDGVPFIETTTLCEDGSIWVQIGLDLNWCCILPAQLHKDPYGNPCVLCEGTGIIAERFDADAPCPDCNGLGYWL